MSDKFEGWKPGERVFTNDEYSIDDWIKYRTLKQSRKEAERAAAIANISIACMILNNTLDKA